MITVTWGSKKHHFKDIEELRAKYPTLNNRPDHIAPKVKKEYKRFVINEQETKRIVNLDMHPTILLT